MWINGPFHLLIKLHLILHFPTVGVFNHLNGILYFQDSDNSSLVVPLMDDLVCDVKVNKLIWLGHGRGLSPGSEN